MGRSRKNETFGELLDGFDDLTSPKPQVVDRKRLLDSIHNLEAAGVTAVQGGERSRTDYAKAMVSRYGAVLALHEKGLVQPPLTEEQVSDLGSRSDMLGVFIEDDREQTAPTDTRGMATADKK